MLPLVHDSDELPELPELAPTESQPRRLRRRPHEAARLQLAGLRSWRTEQELTFDGVDLAAVVGPTGAGKSSILEAIVYGLYNASTYDSRGVTSLVSSDEQTMSVTFDFTADGESWRVTRSTSKKSYPPSVHKLSCLSDPAKHPMVEGEGAVNKYIQSLIGLDLNQFTTAVLLPQGRFQRLLTATSAERTGILKGVFRLDELGEMRERASALRRDHVDPALDAVMDARAKLLPDPQAALDEATADLDRATALAGKLSESQERHNSHRVRAQELKTKAAKSRKLAKDLQQDAAEVPALDDVVEKAAAQEKQASEQRQERERELGLRKKAQGELDAAAKEGDTEAALAAAAQTIRDAQQTLPRLADQDTALNDEREAHQRAIAQLDSDREELTRKTAQLDTARDKVESLATASADAQQRLSGAREALERARAAQAAEEEAKASIDKQASVVRKAEEAAASGQQQADKDRSALQTAEALLKAAEREHQAAVLGHDLHSGDPCPVCQRDLPEDFTAPQAPTALTAAAEQVLPLREIAEGSGRGAAQLAADARAQTDVLGARRTEADQAEQQSATRRTELTATMGEVELSSSDEEILVVLSTAAAKAGKEHEEASRELTVMETTLGNSQTQLDERQRQLDERKTELAARGERLSADRQLRLDALAQLPKLVRPGAASPAALTKALESCEARLDQIGGWAKTAREASDCLEGLDKSLAELAEQRTTDVDEPRRQATGLARDICSSLRNLEDPPPLPAAPSDAAGIDKHATWGQPDREDCRGFRGCFARGCGGARGGYLGGRQTGRGGAYGSRSTGGSGGGRCRNARDRAGRSACRRAGS